MSDAGSERLAFCVSVFGKHPAWADHIEDIPLRTPQLVRVREIFYERGIRKVFDEGLVAGLPESHRLAGFDHLALWEIDGAVVLMRLLRSTDAGGRSAYPLILCVQAPRTHLSFLLTHGADVLDALARDLHATHDGEDVRARVEQADASWQALSLQQHPDDPPGESPSARMTRALGADHTPLHRILFQMEREMASFMPASGTRPRKVHAPPRHIRLPRHDENPLVALRDWLDFLREHLAGGVPVLVATPMGEDYCDAVVGEADARALAALLTTRAAHEPASEIAYELDDAFIERAETALASPVEGGTGGLDRLRGAASTIARHAGTDGEDRRSLRRTLLIALAVVTVLVVVIVAFVLTRGGAPGSGTPGAGGDEPPGQAQTPDAGATSPPKPSRGSLGVSDDQAPDDATLDPWRVWVRAWDAWAMDLARMQREGSLPREIADDEHLMGGLVRPVVQWTTTHDFRTVELRRSPRRIEPGPSLAAHPPDEASAAQALARAREVAQALDTWRTVLRTWPPREQSERAEGELATLGITHEGVASCVRVPDLAPTDGASDIVDWIIAVRAGARDLARIEEAARKVRAALAGPDPPGFWAGDVLRRALTAQAASLDLADLAAILERSEVLARQIEDARGGAWQRVDRDRMMQLYADLLEAPSEASIEAVEALLAAIADPQVQIPSRDDPRVVGEGTSRLRLRMDEALAGFDEIAGRLGDPDTRARIDDARERLAALAPGIDEIESLPWVRAHEEEIVRRTGGVLEEIRSIEAQVHALDAEAMAALGRTIEEIRARMPVGETPPVRRAWQVWRERSCERARQHGPSAPLTAWIDTLERSLLDIEAEIPAWDMPVPAGFDAGAVSDALARDRAARIERVLAGVQWDGSAFADPVGMRRAVMREGAARRSLLDEVRSVMDDLVRTHTAMLATPGAVADGVPFGAGEAWSIVCEGNGRIVGDLRDMEQVGRAAGSEALLLLASDEGIWPAARCEALMRALDAGLDTDGFVCALDLRDGMLAWTAARAPARGEALASSSASAWGALVRACTDRGVLGAIASLAARVDTTRAGLGPHERFNLGVVRIERALTAGEDPVPLARAFLEEMEGVRGRLGAEAGAWLGELDGLVARGGAPGLDRLGPARVGWTAIASDDDGERVIFEREGERISFRRVSEGVFVQEQELSLGALIVQMQGRWEELRGSWGSLDRAMAGEGAFEGPRGWRFEGGQMVVGGDWHDLAPGKSGHWAPGLEAERPSRRMPLQDVSARAGEAISRAFGCRLATVQEWRLALELDEDPRAGENRLDEGWVSQLRFAMETDPLGEDPSVIRPDRGRFYRLEAGSFDPGRDRAAIERVDGVVFFQEVSVGDGFTDLVGNVGEFVRRADGSFGVIGASAMTARSLHRAIAVQVEPDACFVDAGVRLCFDGAGDLSVGRAWRALSSSAPFLVWGE